MTVKRNLFKYLIVMFLTGSSYLHASEVSVSADLIMGPTVIGDPAIISVTVNNMTTHSIHNFDLRLSGSDMMIGGNGVLQFGVITANGSSTLETQLLLSSSNGDIPESIVWQADYDDVAGEHVISELSTVLSNEE